MGRDIIFKNRKYKTWTVSECIELANDYYSGIPMDELTSRYNKSYGAIRSTISRMIAGGYIQRKNRIVEKRKIRNKDKKPKRKRYFFNENQT